MMMSHSTIGFCRLKEVKSQEPHRYRDLGEEIAPQSLAIAMLELDSRRKNAKAIKLLARIWDVTDAGQGNSIVRFNLHTIQHKPCLPIEANFRNGYLDKFLVSAQEQALTDRLEAPVIAAYFGQYHPDHVEKELLAIVHSSKDKEA